MLCEEEAIEMFAPLKPTDSYVASLVLLNVCFRVNAPLKLLLNINSYVKFNLRSSCVRI